MGYFAAQLFTFIMRYILYSLCLLGFSLIFACGGSTTPQTKMSFIDSLNSAIKQDTNNANALYLRAKLYYEGKDKKNIPNGFLDIQRAVDLDSMKADYVVLLADYLLFYNQSRRAKAALERVTGLDPNNTEALLKLGEMYLYVEDYQKAIDFSNKALTIDPNLPRGYFSKGMAYAYSGDTTRALSSFMTAVEQDPQYVYANEQIGRIYAAQGNKLAESYFKNGLMANSSDVNLRYLLAEFYQNQGRLDEAADEYNKILQIQPTNRSAHYNLGYIAFVFNDDAATALKHFSDAIGADPNYAQAYYMRGVCYEKQGNKPAAKADYKKALTFDEELTKAAEGLKRVQ